MDDDGKGRATDSKRRPRAMGQFSSDDDSGSGTTIVGGQPPGVRRRSLEGVPIGLEKVLYAAAVDAEFRARLLRDRDGAVAGLGLELRPSELTALRLAPAAQLQAAIDGLDISVENLERRRFMRTVAGSIATVVGADVLVGCGSAATGSRPGDWRVDSGRDGMASAGVRANDLGRDGMASAGVRANDLGPDGKKD